MHSASVLHVIPLAQKQELLDGDNPCQVFTEKLLVLCSGQLVVFRLVKGNEYAECMSFKERKTASFFCSNLGRIHVRLLLCE